MGQEAHRGFLQRGKVRNLHQSEDLAQVRVIAQLRGNAAVGVPSCRSFVSKSVTAQNKPFADKISSGNGASFTSCTGFLQGMYRLFTFLTTLLERMTGRKTLWRRQ
jgi:hypothetical protein